MAKKAGYITKKWETIKDFIGLKDRKHKRNFIMLQLELKKNHKKYLKMNLKKC